jgi:hypothetical protein
VEQVLDNLAILPAWAKALLALIALAPAAVALRAVARARREQDEGEYEAWRRVLGPKGWIGHSGKETSARGTRVEFEDRRAQTTRRLRITGRHGDGALTLYGSLSKVGLELDLEEAREVGVLDALRPTRHAARLALLLEPEVERALTDLPDAFADHARATLSIRKRLELAWETPTDLRGEHPGALVADRGALLERAQALERDLMGREVEGVGEEALARAARDHGPVGRVLAARALLTLYPDGPQAEELRAQLLGSGADPALRGAVIGCAFDARVLAAHGITPDGHVARIQAMIARGDLEMGRLLARRGVEAYGAPAMLSWRAQLAASRTEVLVYKDHRVRKKRDQRDRHTFACAVLASFRGTEDADDFALALDALLEHVRPDAEHPASFSRAMGRLEDWSPALVRRALARPAHDDVYGYWTGALEAAWDDALAATLEQVARAPELGARGLTAILEAASARGHVRMVDPARDATARLARDWSTDPRDERALRAALAALEAQLDDATREGVGKLSVAAHQGREGGLSVSRRGGALSATEEVDEQVTLDLERTEDEGDADAQPAAPVDAEVGVDSGRGGGTP